MTELLNTDIDEVKFNEFYVKNLEVQAELYNDAIILLDYLKNKYKLYVASNGMYKVQINRLKIAKILDYFTDIFISEDIGYNKPDPNFFKAIISKIDDNNLDEYIIIGDRIDADIKGGISFGINAILVNRDNIKTEYKNVKNLKDIIGIL
jgi:HAD superfamily hydrolase (TIGR01549 family)